MNGIVTFKKSHTTEVQDFLNRTGRHPERSREEGEYLSLVYVDIDPEFATKLTTLAFRTETVAVLTFKRAPRQKNPLTLRT